MALRETTVELDVIVDADPLRELNQQINDLVRNTGDMGGQLGNVINIQNNYYNNTLNNIQNINNTINNLNNDIIQGNQDQTNGLDDLNGRWDRNRRRIEMISDRFMGLASISSQWIGSTGEFIGEINDAARELRAYQDSLINNNLRVRASFYQQIGMLNTMTTLPRRISNNYERMGNPFYNINRGALGVADALWRMGNRSSAAAIALRQLGPTASMKQLLDHTRMINQGLMTLPFAALGAAVAVVKFYGAIHKAAMENKTYSDAFTTMLANLRKAVQPMIDVFIMIMVPVYNFINAIAKMIIKFNEAHPVLAKIIQGVMLLVPALTLLLLPLGLGIGLVGGFAAAWGFAAPIIMPFVTFFAAMSSTVWLVAAAIVGLVAGVVIMYNKFAWFRDAVNGIWAAIQNAAMIAWNFILNSIIRPIVTAITTFVNTQLAVLKAFWQQNGTQIMMIVQMYFNIIKTIIVGTLNVIKGVFQAVWPIITGVVKVAWALIQVVISTAINMVLGIIKTVLALLRGDWEGAWNSIKATAESIWKSIVSIFESIDLYSIGADIIRGLISGIGSMASGVVGAVKGIVSSVKGTFTKMMGINSPSRLFMEYGVNTVQGYTLGLDKMHTPLQQASYDMANIPASYTPESNISQNNSRSSNSLVFNPTFNYNGNGGDSKGIREQWNEMKDEMFDYLTANYDTGVVR